MPGRNHENHNGNLSAHFEIDKPQFLLGAIIGCILTHIISEAPSCITPPLLLCTASLFAKLNRQFNWPSLLLGLFSGSMFRHKLLDIDGLSNHLRHES